MKWGSVAPLGQATTSELEFFISKFESSRSSPSFLRSTRLTKRRDNGPEIWNFAYSLSSLAFQFAKVEAK